MSVEEAIQKCFIKQDETGVMYTLPDDFPAFKGHFENYPLLPAVCHLSFCADAASRQFKKPVEIRAVKRAKFMSPVLPRTQLVVRLTDRPDGWLLAEIISVESGKKLSQLTLQVTERK